MYDTDEVERDKIIELEQRVQWLEDRLEPLLLLGEPLLEQLVTKLKRH